MDPAVQSNTVERSPTSVKVNTLPFHAMGEWLREQFRLDFRVKPAFDDPWVMVEICPALIVLSAATGVERFRYQTSTNFKFSGLHSLNFIEGAIYHFMCLAVDDFNDSLKGVNSLMARYRSMDKPKFEEMEPWILQCSR